MATAAAICDDREGVGGGGGGGLEIRRVMIAIGVNVAEYYPKKLLIYC